MIASRKFTVVPDCTRSKPILDVYEAIAAVPIKPGEPHDNIRGYVASKISTWKYSYADGVWTFEVPYVPLDDYQ